MAKAVAAGRRVVLITCTRGEMGEIVVPDMDTPDNHRRLGEIRAGELERAMGVLGRHRVGEPRLPRLGHDGSGREPRPALVLAGRPRRGRPAARLADPALPARRRSRPTTTSAATATPTTSGPTTSRSARSSGPATPRWYPEQLAPEHGGTGRPPDEGGLAPWTPSKLYEQAIPASVRTAMRDRHGASSASRPLVAAARRHARAAGRVRGVPGAGCSCPTSRSRPGSTSRGDPLERKWHAMQRARDPDRATTAVHGRSGSTAGASTGRTRPSSCASRPSRRPSPSPTCSPGSPEAATARGQ